MADELLLLLLVHASPPIRHRIAHEFPLPLGRLCRWGIAEREGRLARELDRVPPGLRLGHQDHEGVGQGHLLHVHGHGVELSTDGQTHRTYGRLALGLGLRRKTRAQEFQSLVMRSLLVVAMG
jgi:hypothetical protein